MILGGGCSVLTETDPAILDGPQSGAVPVLDAGLQEPASDDPAGEPSSPAVDAGSTAGDPNVPGGGGTAGGGASGDDEPGTDPGDPSGGSGGAHPDESDRSDGGAPDTPGPADEPEPSGMPGDDDDEPEEDGGDGEGDEGESGEESGAVSCGEGACSLSSTDGCCYAGDETPYCYGESDRPRCTCGVFCHATPIQCDDRADCAEGQRCCASLDLLGRVHSTACVDSCDDTLIRNGREVCDPGHDSCRDGTECVRRPDAPGELHLCEERD